MFFVFQKIGHEGVAIHNEWTDLLVSFVILCIMLYAGIEVRIDRMG